MLMKAAQVRIMTGETKLCKTQLNGLLQHVKGLILLTIERIQTSQIVGCINRLWLKIQELLQQPTSRIKVATTIGRQDLAVQLI